jgi:hypothetical protein
MHPHQPAAQRQRVLAHVADTDIGGFFDLLTAPQLLATASLLCHAVSLPSMEHAGILQTAQHAG